MNRPLASSRTPRCFVLLVVTGGASCSMAPAGPEEAIEARIEGADLADHDCQVVLRDVGRVHGKHGPYATVDGWFVWEGSVDVARGAVDDGATIVVQYRRDERDWHEVVAFAEEGAGTDGYQRFTFQFWEGVIRDGEGGTNFLDMRLELIPLLRMPDGTRVYDHNRVANDLDSYVLTYSDWGPHGGPFGLGDDPAVCLGRSPPPDPPVVHFPAAGDRVVEGELSPGGRVRVDYDHHRLLDAHPECIRRTDYGTIGEVQMGVKIDDDPGQVSYHQFVAGFSTTGYYTVPIRDTIDLPADATKLTLWFSCGGPFHDWAYDNNQGHGDYDFGL